MPARPKSKIRRESKRAATKHTGFFRGLYGWFVTADKRLKGVVGIGILGGLYLVASHVPDGLRWVNAKLFLYPVELTYLRQGETKTGYVFELQIKSTNGSAVFIPRNDFGVRIVRDQQLVDAMPIEARKGLLYGETANILDNVFTLD